MGNAVRTHNQDVTAFRLRKMTLEIQEFVASESESLRSLGVLKADGRLVLDLANFNGILSQSMEINMQRPAVNERSPLLEPAPLKGLRIVSHPKSPEFQELMTMVSAFRAATDSRISTAEAEIARIQKIYNVTKPEQVARLPPEVLHEILSIQHGIKRDRQRKIEINDTFQSAVQTLVQADTAAIHDIAAKFKSDIAVKTLQTAKRAQKTMDDKATDAIEAAKEAVLELSAEAKDSLQLSESAAGEALALSDEDLAEVTLAFGLTKTHSEITVSPAAHAGAMHTNVSPIAVQQATVSPLNIQAPVDEPPVVVQRDAVVSVGSM